MNTIFSDNASIFFWKGFILTDIMSINVKEVYTCTFIVLS